MADPVISRQELVDASRDALDYEKVVNGGVGVTTVTRSGRTLPSVEEFYARREQQIANSLARVQYPSVAAMNADAANRDKIAIVHSDTLANNGNYYWTGASWQKTALQPATADSVDFIGKNVVVIADSLSQVLIETLGNLRRELRSPLYSVNLKLVGDSITWGSGASGTSPSTPRDGTLADPRNTIDASVSPTWANLLRRWMCRTYGDGPIQTLAPGHAFTTAKNVIDVFGGEASSIVWRQGNGAVIPSSRVQAGVVAQAQSETGKRLDFYPNLANYPVEFEFETSAVELELIFAKTGESSTGQDVNVYVDGALYKTFSAYGVPAAWNAKEIVLLDGARHQVRVRSMATAAVWRFLGINATRRILVANDGIIGSGTYSWLNRVTLAQSIKPTDTHVFVQLGTNDRVTAATNSVYLTYQRLPQIVAGIRAIAPRADITLISANAVTQSEAAGSAYSFTMRVVDTIIRDVAEKMGCGFISQYEMTLQDKLDGIDITPDGLHPGDATQRKMFENIRNRLQVS
ncbi:SGNH/GDSL hydrolase family protein [Alcaligenaceae bacterium B3P038]|nr:SGNH/GDSL hydrolase family protein [Alcaligenaceae bacterium B3P038]